CRLGGMLSDATLDTVERLDDFGMALGLAFQLSDDIMDVTSTEEELRKLPGQDMREGVYTLPVLHALADGSNGRKREALLRDWSPWPSPQPGSSPPAANSPRSSPPTSVGSTPSARAGPRPRFAITSTPSCS